MKHRQRHNPLPDEANELAKRLITKTEQGSVTWAAHTHTSGISFWMRGASGARVSFIRRLWTLKYLLYVGDETLFRPEKALCKQLWAMLSGFEAERAGADRRSIARSLQGQSNSHKTLKLSQPTPMRPKSA